MSYLNETVARNNTESLYFKPTRHGWFWVTLGFICVVTTIGNTLVILLICSKRSFRHKVSPNWFILSLGFADLLIGSFNIPVQLVCTFAAKCTFFVSNLMYSFGSLFLTASTMNVCLLTFDIYVAVFHPFWYPNLMSPSKSRLFIFSSWLLSAILNIAMFISAMSPTRNVHAELADQIITILFYTLSSVFLAYAFGRILLVVRSHKREIERHQIQLESNATSCESLTDSLTPNGRMRRRNRDGTITATGVITASFLICNGIWQYKLIHYIWPKIIPMNRSLVDISHMVMYLNCTMNFIVYALLRNDLRGELESYFTKLYKKGNERETIGLQSRQMNIQSGGTLISKVDPD